MNDTSANTPKIYLRKPIKGLRVAYYGPEPVRMEEVARREQAAYQRGQNDAQTVCQHQIMQTRGEMTQLQNDVLATIQNRYNEFTEQFNEQLPDLVLTIVEKIWEGLELDRNAVLRAIDAALVQAGNDTRELVLRLCPKDAALLHDTETFQTRFPDLKIETDPELTPGDVMLRSRFGIVDARIETKLRRVEEEIKKAHQ